MMPARLPEKVPGGPRILWLHQGAGDAQRYRCIHAQEQLALYSVGSTLRHYMTAKPEDADVDVAILHRIPLDRRVDEFIEGVRENGGVLLFETDDLVFSPMTGPQARAPYGESPIRLALYRDEVRRYRATLSKCDAALVSTHYLAQQVSLLGIPAWRHRNAFSLTMAAISEEARRTIVRDGRRLVIGYASGTPTHSRDFRQAKPALQKVLARHPHAELWIVGHLDPGSDWGAAAERVNRLPFVAWQELPSVLAQFDINIAPLDAADPFCQAKSEVKYIEAGLVGVPTIASRTDAFEFAIRPGDNGFLADTDADWSILLEQLIGDPVLRTAMGDRAYADVLARYHPLVRGRELMQTLSEISDLVRGQHLWAEAPRVASGGPVTVPATLRRLAVEEITESLTRSLSWRIRYSVRNRGARTALLQLLAKLWSRLSRA